MLYMIGLGLENEKDVSVKGLEAIKTCSKVFLEGYTSILQVSKESLEGLYGKPVEILPREGVEQHADNILEAAKENAAFLVVGDVFGATTHHDLYLRAKEAGIEVKVIPNASIMNAISLTGLDLYKFGRTCTLVYPEESFKPDSFYDVIKNNLANNLHTLCLLDIKTDQERFMTIPEGIGLLLEIEADRFDSVLSPDTVVVGAARLGTSSQQIKKGTMKELKEIDWGNPPHCFVIPANLSVIEEEMLNSW